MCLLMVDAVAWNSRPQAPLPTNKMDHEINTVIISFFDDIQNEGFLPPRYDIFKEASGREIIFWVEENLKRVFKGVYVKISLGGWRNLLIGYFKNDEVVSTCKPEQNSLSKYWLEFLFSNEYKPFVLNRCLVLFYSLYLYYKVSILNWTIVF